jgi:hypothetical protein
MYQRLRLQLRSRERVDVDEAQVERAWGEGKRNRVTEFGCRDFEVSLVAAISSQRRS